MPGSQLGHTPDPRYNGILRTKVTHKSQPDKINPKVYCNVNG